VVLGGAEVGVEVGFDEVGEAAVGFGGGYVTEAAVAGEFVDPAFEDGVVEGVVARVEAADVAVYLVGDEEGDVGLGEGEVAVYPAVGGGEAHVSQVVVAGPAVAGTVDGVVGVDEGGDESGCARGNNRAFARGMSELSLGG